MTYHQRSALATLRATGVIKTFAVALLVTGMAGAVIAPESGSAATSATPGARDSGRPVGPGDLLVVDCLLPGQLRQLGTRTTYSSARRPAKLTARDCAIRGGEYVAADRASGDSSLRVWLAAAQAGDPEAATIVGEIFERGLAGQADYASAATWYRRAAEQGAVRAAINLGHLYEKGLGVPRDMAEALRWYRRAAGTDSPVSLDPGRSAGAADAVATAERMARLEAQIETLRSETERLRAELAKAAAGPPPQAMVAPLPPAVPAPVSAPPLRVEGNPPSAAVNARLEAQLEALRAELASESARGSELLQQIADARAKLSGTEAQLAEARRREAARLEEIRRAGAAVNDLREAEKASVERLTSLEQVLRARETELDRQRADAGRLGATVARLETDLAAQRQRLEASMAATAATPVPIAAVAAVPPAAIAGPELSIIEPPILATRGIEVVPAAALPVAMTPSAEQQIVGRVAAPAGLLSLQVNGVTLEPNDYGVFTTRIRLEPVQSRVSILAIDRQGKRAVLDFDLKRASPFAAEAVASRSSEDAERLAVERAAIEPGRHHALIIGNNEYATLADLKTPIEDANALATVLRERYGFETTVLTNASRYDILSALNVLREKMTSEDRLLIYYAGHGQIDEVNNRSYWLPVDAEPASNANWIPSLAITDLVNIIQSRHVMLVVDSCYSGALTRSSVPRMVTGMTQAERLRWLQAVSRKRSRTVLASGGVEPVLDSGGGQNSVFARALLDVLRENRELLDGQSLFREVAARVAYAAERVGFDQVPEYAPIRFAGHEGGEFHFVPRL